jgi:hypothetical protein
MLYNLWWKAEKSEVHTAIWNICQTLKDQQHDRIKEDIIHLKQYGNIDISSVLSGSILEAKTVNKEARAKRNIIFSAIDTLTSKIAQKKPRPFFKPYSNDFEVSNNCEVLTDYVTGLFQSLGIYKQTREIFRNSGWKGEAHLKIWVENDEIKTESVFPLEVWVDAFEAMTGNPRSMYQVKTVPKEVLMARFKNKKGEIETSACNINNFWIESHAEFIDVVEAWHLRSGPDAKDGRHVIAVSDGSLIDEPWEYDFFPFVTWRWKQRGLGWYGMGIAEQLDGIQTDINLMMLSIQRNLHLNSQPYWWIPTNAEIPVGAINNEFGRIIRSRQPPKLFTFQQMPSDFYQWLALRKQEAFEEIGLSELSVAAKKPAGLESGVSLREYADIETERFKEVGLDWQDFHVEIGRRLVILSKEIASNYDFVMPSVKRDIFSKIIWEEVDLSSDKYQMVAYPTSSLPSRPEGQLAFIEQMLKMQLIKDPEIARDLLDWPDLNKYNDMHSGLNDAVKQIVDRIAKTGEYEPPDPLFPADHCLSYALMVYGRMNVEKYPELNKQSIREWINDCQEMIREAQEAQEAQAVQEAQEAQAPEALNTPGQQMPQ